MRITLAQPVDEERPGGRLLPGIAETVLPCCYSIVQFRQVSKRNPIRFSLFIS